MSADVSAKQLEAGRAFLSALFVGLRSAQLHDPANQAFQKSVHMLFGAADALYSCTGGFSIQFVDDAAFLNGQRLQFEGGAFESTRTVRRLLEERGLGGLEISTPPSHNSIQKIVLFASGADSQGGRLVSREELESLDVGLLGIQKMADASSKVTVDRKVVAVQSYAKLILTLREQIERIEHEDTSLSTSFPRLRAVRVVQDLVELCADRPDMLGRLSNNMGGATASECLCANACLISISIAVAIGADRQDAVDMGVAALFHRISLLATKTDSVIHIDDAITSMSQLVAGSGVGRSADLRVSMITRHPAIGLDGPLAETATSSDPYSQAVGVAIAYAHFVTGVGMARCYSPLEAMGLLAGRQEGRFDRRIVDVLMNVLRVFPPGVRVVLDDGATAVVRSHGGGARWDRPIVKLDADGTQVDLMSRDGDRFVRWIVATVGFQDGAPAPALEPVTGIQAQAALYDSSSTIDEASDDIMVEPDIQALLGAALEDTPLPELPAEEEEEEDQIIAEPEAGPADDPEPSFDDESPPVIDGRWTSDAGTIAHFEGAGEFVVVRTTADEATRTDPYRALWVGRFEFRYVDKNGVTHAFTVDEDGSVAIESFTQRWKTVGPDVSWWRKTGVGG